jgi:hypothetical protein
MMRSGHRYLESPSVVQISVITNSKWDCTYFSPDRFGANECDMFDIGTLGQRFRFLWITDYKLVRGLSDIMVGSRNLHLPE